MTVRPLVAKEIRALLPIWIASAAAMAAALSVPRLHWRLLVPGSSHEWMLLAFVFGAATLGSQSIGHEYTGHMLTSLLSQPRPRRQLLLLKFAVLTIMLLGLAGLALLLPVPEFDRGLAWQTVFNALCLAPLVTMACRTPVAGVVFTGALPLWIQAIAEYVNRDALLGGAAIVFAAGAVAGWRLFMRLEAVDGRGPDLELPGVSRASSSAVASKIQHPVWQIVKKELHLQQMTFAVAAVWLAIWTSISVVARVFPWFEAFPIGAVGILYGALLALLIGALASAGERELDTVEWQTLQPMAAWQQWAVKVGTVIALAAMLGWVGPVQFAAGQIGFSPVHAGAILALAVGSLYVSTLCRSGIRALTIAAPILLAVSMAAAYAAGIYRIGFGGQHLAALTAAPLAIGIPLMLWFGLENHRTAAQRAGRITTQAFWIAGGVALGLGVVAAVLA